MNNQGLYDHQRKKYNDGVDVENTFINVATLNGFSCRKSTNYQDYKEHWDVEIRTPEGDYEYVDIKGMKDVHDLGYTWVEEKNVRGETGWLHADKLDAVVFEKKDRFVFIKMVDLRNLIEKNVRFRNGLFFDKGKDVSERLYCRYQRPGRSDVIILTPFEDIDKHIYRTILKKN